MKPMFPLSARRHKGKDDKPPSPDAFGIYDAHGYWVNLDGIFFQMPAKDPGNATVVDHVARMLNAAYQQGRKDAQKDVRESLGIEEL